MRWCQARMPPQELRRNLNTIEVIVFIPHGAPQSPVKLGLLTLYGECPSSGLRVRCAFGGMFQKHASGSSASLVAQTAIGWPHQRGRSCCRRIVQMEYFAGGPLVGMSQSTRMGRRHITIKESFCAEIRHGFHVVALPN